MSEKLCVFCRNFRWEHIGVGADYSEFTGGDPYGGASCSANHFSEERPSDTEEFRKLILQAEKCTDYKEAK